MRLAVAAGDLAAATALLADLEGRWAETAEAAQAAALVALASGGAPGGGRTAPGGPAALAVAGAGGASALVVGVAPNPVADRAALGVEVASDAAMRVVVYDAAGRAVAVAFDGALSAGAHRLALDASALAPGVYVAHVVAHPATGGAAAVAVRRFVVAR